MLYYFTEACNLPYGGKNGIAFISKVLCLALGGALGVWVSGQLNKSAQARQNAKELFKRKSEEAQVICRVRTTHAAIHRFFIEHSDVTFRNDEVRDLLRRHLKVFAEFLSLRNIKPGLDDYYCQCESFFLSTFDDVQVFPALPSYVD